MVPLVMCPLSVNGDVDVFRMSKLYASKFLQIMEETLQQYGCVFDLPVESIYRPEKDNRIIQRQNHHGDVQAAETFGVDTSR